MITMIKEEDYKDLKPYWDYQRKVAYNKEQVFQMVGNFEGRVFPIRSRKSSSLRC